MKPSQYFLRRHEFGDRLIYGRLTPARSETYVKPNRFERI